MNEMLSHDRQRYIQGDLKVFKDKTIIVTGASRGIGLYIAKKLFKYGANVVILSKTTQIHAKLPGTIYTAKNQIQSMKGCGKVLAIKCDIRKQQEVVQSIQAVIKQFGKIDGVVNNAGAIDLSKSQSVTIKKFDLMNSINARGSFLMIKACLPYLVKSNSPFICNITPPISMLKDYPIGKKGLPYIISKMGMSMTTLGISQQYPNIRCFGLWPKKTVATAAVKNVVGTSQQMQRARTCWIVADALFILLTQYNSQVSGKFFFDEEIINKKGLNLQDYKMSNEELNNFHKQFKPKL